MTRKSRTVGLIRQYPRYATYCAVWTLLSIGALIWGAIYISPWFPLMAIAAGVVLSLASAVGERVQKRAVRRDEAGQ